VRKPLPLLTQALGLAASLVLVFLVSAVGAAVTLPKIAGWYASLVHPSWTPPDRVFGPVWTVLYVLMALAAWLVWRKAGWQGARGSLGLYGAQLLLNMLWSILFFGLGWITVALAEIVLLWALVLATLLAFSRHVLPASFLFVPYLLWLSYAVSLNAGFWQLNR
jgi:benzodiazapine receptor